MTATHVCENVSSHVAEKSKDDVEMFDEPYPCKKCSCSDYVSRLAWPGCKTCGHSLTDHGLRGAPDPGGI